MDQDDMWTGELLKDLPSVPVPGALEQRILGDFDCLAAQRGRGLAGFAALLRDAVWPGAPLWRPAGVLAFALAVGVTVGTYVPLEEILSDGAEQTASVALDAPPTF